MISNSLEMAQREGMFWGNAQTDSYFQRAETAMDQYWERLIRPFLAELSLQVDGVVDLASGHGRNVVKLLQIFQSVTAVDINPENIAFLRQRFAGDPRVTIVQNNGCSLATIPDSSFPLIYCFDAMVHFDVEIVIDYIKECHRVLRPGGYGLLHHSNYTGAPGNDFRKNPYWRNFMSQELFAHLCIHNGLMIVKQKVFDWGNAKDLDCFTAFQRPVAGKNQENP